MIRILTLALLTLALARAAIAQSLESLLRGVSLPPARSEAYVRVEGAIQEQKGARALVVRLTPVGEARLVADPGIQAIALPGPSGPWAAVERLEIVDREQRYFDGPVELSVPVRDGASGEAAVAVEYAWCRIEQICLFGGATVAVQLPAPSG